MHVGPVPSQGVSSVTAPHRDARREEAVKKHDDVVAYLAKLPPKERKVLGELHEFIASLLSGAETKISYGVPTFRFENRGVIAFGATKAGLSLYVMSPKLMAALKPSLAKYGPSGVTMKFTADAPLPNKLVTVRVAEHRALDAKRRKKA
ncbi:MAG: hypothetical protein DI536_19560 [Archangium gephyra]|uniref:YdhG-like domain-containing protein n=1 Tax=Archangium gephyra TaxID=48 RepID=A0A2W5TDG5_9BACT|nr:MAG: hypothetical protein DI536_19560 [Archangium gephyra]